MAAVGLVLLAACRGERYEPGDAASGASDQGPPESGDGVSQTGGRRTVTGTIEGAIEGIDDIDGAADMEEPTSQPATDGVAAMHARCDALGAECGALMDGGGMLNCGECGSDEVCGSDGADNQCCYVSTCDSYGAECGTLSDGCGGTLDCGACPEGQTCGGAGEANRCGEGPCEPKTCADSNAECGTLNDGCGNMLDCGTCADGEICGGGALPFQCEAPAVVEEDEPPSVEGGCVTWPIGSPGGTISVRRRDYLAVGHQYTDFTLADLEGREHTLSDLIAEGPVMLQTGSYTCPVYREHVPATDALIEELGDRVRFVVIYVAEAHPIAPDLSPYSGRVHELEYSHHGQPTTYAERVAIASEMSAVDGERSLLLVDTLGGADSDLYWCGYQTQPNGALLIDGEGTVRAVHRWFDPETMRQSILTMLGEP